MRIQDIMKPSVVTIAPNLSLEEAFGLLMKKNIHHLVVMEEGRVVGVLSASDLAGLSVQERQLLTVKECMSREVTCVPPDMLISAAAERMRKHHIECLPVCKDRELIGIVAVSDLLDVFCKDLNQLEEADWCGLEDRPIPWRIHPYT